MIDITLGERDSLVGVRIKHFSAPKSGANPFYSLDLIFEGGHCFGCYFNDLESLNEFRRMIAAARVEEI